MPGLNHLLLATSLVLAAQARSAQPGFAGVPGAGAQLLISPTQLFAFAEAARERGDLSSAENAYRALAAHPNLQIRTEARFRLGMMYRVGRPSEAALLFRQILDEQPTAQRVRLELAQVLDRLGDESGARRALREVQAGGLPPDVVQYVDRYSAALRAQKPLGMTFEVALAPDSNINRATRSDTLGTVLGDFTLSEDAKQKSGVGAAVRGQSYARIRVSERVNLLGRVAGSADVYRDSDYNDVAIALSAGPELVLGRDRMTVEANRTWRWFGGELWLRNLTVGITYLLPLGRRAQLRLGATVGTVDHRLNRQQGGRNYAVSVSYERALTSTAGVGGSLWVDRQALRDPGYATKSGQIAAFAYKELGAMTLVGSLSAGRLEADERLFLYPRPRRDRLYRASLGATLRQLEIGGFAPFVRVTRETNRSNIEIFDYGRTRTEMGITRAF